MRRWNSALVLGTALAAVVACKGSAPRSDAMIASEVREDLREVDELNGEAITVQSVNGEVTLQGVVPSEDAKQKAEDVADDVNGVTRVANRLQVASGPTSAAPPVSAPPPATAPSPSPGTSPSPTTMP